MTMIEKMAKAMYLNYANHPDARWDAVDPRMQEGVWRAHARVALTAMLEPSNAMIEGVMSESSWGRAMVCIEARQVIVAAIQAALDEK